MTLVSCTIGLDHIQTDIIAEHIGMWQSCKDADSGWVIGVAVRELHLDVENTTFIGSLGRASDVAVPGEQVFTKGSGHYTHSWNVLVVDFLQVLGQSLHGESLVLLVDRGSPKSLVT